MSTDENFVAQILETSAAGYAGLSASLLFERDPEIETGYAENGFSDWKAQLQRWLIDLSASVAAAEPALFESRMRWTRKAFVARGAAPEHLQAALEAMRDTLRERLPEASVDAVVPTVERAIASVAAAEEFTEDSRWGAPAGPEALAYLEKILEGNPREAIDRVLAAVDGGTPVKDAYLNIAIPAQRETGRMWHAGQLSIGEEHVITATTQRLMALLSTRAQPDTANGKTVLLACVAGNVHDVGIRVISDFYELAGWRSVNLGPDVPTDEIARSVQIFNADVVILAAVLDPHVKQVQRAIARIRALDDREVKIIVGGPAFEQVPDLWRKIGADGHAAGIEDAEPLGSELTA